MQHGRARYITAAPLGYLLESPSLTLASHILTLPHVSPGLFKLKRSDKTS